MSKKINAPAKKTQAANQPAVQNRLDAKEIIKVAGILTAICVFISAALAGVNMLTEERIRQIAKENEFAACETVFPPVGNQKLEFTPFEEIISGSDVSGYLAADNGQPAGCVIITSAKGYGGDVQIMVGFDANRTITGVSVLSHSETPGLGANAANPAFLSQFTGIEGAGDLAVVKDGGTVDAVTAATISSRAVTAAVNSAAQCFDSLNAAGIFDGATTAGGADIPASNSDVVSGADVSGSDANNQQGGAQ